MKWVSNWGKALVFSNIWIAICSAFWSLGAFQVLHGSSSMNSSLLGDLAFAGINAACVFVFYSISRGIFPPQKESASSELNIWLLKYGKISIISAIIVALGLLWLNFEVLWSYQFWIMVLPGLAYWIQWNNHAIRKTWWLKPIWIAGAWWWFTVGVVQDPGEMVPDGWWISASLFLFLLELSMLSDWVDASEDRKHKTDTWINHLSLLQVQIGVGVLQSIVTFAADSYVPVILLLISNLAYWAIPKFMKNGWKNMMVQESILLAPYMIYLFKKILNA